MILDVGCGEAARGDVNIDLHPEVTFHRGSGNPINVKDVPNFIVADAMHLPFKDESFSVVRSSHVIEHASDPVKFIKECLRVSSSKVEISCPHRYQRQGLRLRQSRSHCNYFNITWFGRTLRRLGYIINLKYTPKPHVLLPLVLWPSWLYVTIRKRRLRASGQKNGEGRRRHD